MLVRSISDFFSPRICAFYNHYITDDLDIFKEILHSKQCNVINFYLCWFKFNKTKFETNSNNWIVLQLDRFVMNLILQT